MNAKMNRLNPGIGVAVAYKSVMTPHAMSGLVLLLLGVVMLSAVATPCFAQGEKSEEAEKEKAEKSLSKTQEQIAAQFRIFEKKLLRMAELSDSTHPGQAAKLRRIIAESRERLVNARFKELTELLKDKKYTKAIETNKELCQDLVDLLRLLDDLGGINEHQKEYDELMGVLRSVKILRIKEADLQQRTEDSQNPKGLTPEQEKLAEKTGNVKKQLENPSGKGKSGKGKSGKGKSGEGKSGEGKSGEGKSGEGKSGEGKSGEGKSGEGKSDSERLHSTKSIEERLKAAQEKMEEAAKKLKNAEKEGALKDQDAAKRELEAAQKELEEILRQLREIIQEEKLLAIEARIKKMLKLQTGVWKDTEELDKVPAEKRDKQHEINAGHLGSREMRIVGIADQTMLLFEEDGTVVAMPEALSQAQEDMRQVVTRLNRAEVGPITIGIEEAIVDALKEMLDAVQKELEKLEERKSGKSGQQTKMDQPLVDQLAELKMLLSMEKSIRKRTGTLEKLSADPKVKKADLMERHRVLARRQERIYEITQAIASGMNK